MRIETNTPAGKSSGPVKRRCTRSSVNRTSIRLHHPRAVHHAKKVYIAEGYVIIWYAARSGFTSEGDYQKDKEVRKGTTRSYQDEANCNGR